MASYRFHHDATVEDDLRRIARDQVDKALAELAEEQIHDAVHQVRKRCKKIRALLRLVRGAEPDLYDRENAWYRDTARLVSDARDATAAIETLDLLRGADIGVYASTLDRVREGLLDRRGDLEDEHLDAAVSAVADRLEESRARIGDWTVGAQGWDALEGGLARTYGRVRARLDDAEDDPTSVLLHEWRKRVKYHRYHMRLLQDTFPGPVRARKRALHDLSDLLGDDNDLWELRVLLHAEPDRFGGRETVATVTAALDRLRADLQARAFPLGRKLTAESTDALVARFGAIWAAWRAERRPGADRLLADNRVPVGA